MNLQLSTSLGAALLLGATAFINPAHAGFIYQSATAGSAPNGGFVVQGDGTTDGSNILGGVFTLTKSELVGSIGGDFLVSNGNSGGSIFGEIVQIAAGASFPSQSIDQLNPIARVVFTPTVDGDNAVALSVLLQAGTYAVLFGGNSTDATGFATLADNNTPAGSPSLFEDNFGAADPAPWDTLAPADARIFVAVSEPASLSLLGAGLMMFGLYARRRA